MTSCFHLFLVHARLCVRAALLWAPIDWLVFSVLGRINYWLWKGVGLCFEKWLWLFSLRNAWRSDTHAGQSFWKLNDPRKKSEFIIIVVDRFCNGIKPHSLWISLFLPPRQVILELTTPSSRHVPYRDSKLTRILQDRWGSRLGTRRIRNFQRCIFNDQRTGALKPVWHMTWRSPKPLALFLG